MSEPFISSQIVSDHLVALIDVRGNRCDSVSLPIGTLKSATVNGAYLNVEINTGRRYVYDVSSGAAILRSLGDPLFLAKKRRERRPSAEIGHALSAIIHPRAAASSEN